MQAGDAERAAQLLKDPAWKGSAQYRAGNYEKALENFSALNNADAFYNRGNALAHLGRLQEAISAYDQALKQDPQHADAQHNKALVEKLLEQQQPENAQNQNGGQNPQAQQNQNSSSKNHSQSPTDQDNPQKNQQTGKESEQSSTGQDNPQKDQQESKGNKQSPDSNENQKNTPNTMEPSASEAPDIPPKAAAAPTPELTRPSENEQALNQWLRRIPDDPGGLLRRKFWLEHLRRRQQAP